MPSLGLRDAAVQLACDAHEYPFHPAGEVVQDRSTSAQRIGVGPAWSARQVLRELFQTGELGGDSMSDRWVNGRVRSKAEPIPTTLQAPERCRNRAIRRASSTARSRSPDSKWVARMCARSAARSMHRQI